jgi:hypothetical protein
MCLLGCNSDSSKKAEETKKETKSSGSSAKPKVECPNPFVLKHKTVATKPSDRLRTTVGIGEEVDIWTDPATSVTWSIVGDDGKKGKLSTTSGDKTQYTAHDRAVTVTIEAKSPDCTQTIAFTVKELDTSTIKKLSDTSTLTTTHVQVGFGGAPYGQPTDVSFYNVDTREGECLGQASGLWASANGDKHNDTGSWIAATSTVTSDGTYLSGDDTINTPRYPLTNFPKKGTTDGRFLWPIPWRAQVRGGGVSGAYVYDTLNHLEEYDSKTRVLKMSKGGSSSTRTIP